MGQWRKLTAAALGTILLLSQGLYAFAQEAVDFGSGKDSIDSIDSVNSVLSGTGEDQMPLYGVGENGSESADPDMAAGLDLSSLLDGEASGGGDMDTCILEDINLSIPLPDSAILKSANDGYFYNIFTWGEDLVPHMMVGVLEWSTTDGFFDAYTDYMGQTWPDITVAEGPVSLTISDKALEKIVYNYSMQGYRIVDTRYVWPADGRLYMFVKREVPDVGSTLGNTLEDMIAGASLLTQTDVSQPEAAPAPGASSQPESQPARSLYVQNEDKSWAVTTDYYSMTIPAAWTGHFDAEVLRPSQAGYNLKVVHSESRDAGMGGDLFTILLLSTEEDYTIYPSYDYLGTITTPEGVFNVVVDYPTDLRTNETWKPIYDILYADKNSALSTLTPAAGVTWTLPNGNTLSGDRGGTDSEPAPSGGTDGGQQAPDGTNGQPTPPDGTDGQPTPPGGTDGGPQAPGGNNAEPTPPDGTDGGSAQQISGDTCILSDIGLQIIIPDGAVLMDSEDEGFYYVYPGGGNGIPDIIIGSFDWNTTDGFFDAYTEYMQGARPDLTVAESPADLVIADKNLKKIVYNYQIQGYQIKDTRCIWLAGGRLYMFAKREIPDMAYTVGSSLEDIISSASLLGA